MDAGQVAAVTEVVGHRDTVHRLHELGLLPTQAATPAPHFTDAEAGGIRAAAAIRAAMIESTDAEFGKLLQSELDRWGKVVKETGATVN